MHRRMEGSPRWDEGSCATLGGRHDMPYADLELSLHPLPADQYVVEMRLVASDDEADKRLDPPAPPVIALGAALEARLRQVEIDPQAYGKVLTSALFGDPQVTGFYSDALKKAHDMGTRLRFCLTIPRSAAHLHRRRW